MRLNWPQPVLWNSTTSVPILESLHSLLLIPPLILFSFRCPTGNPNSKFKTKCSTFPVRPSSSLFAAGGCGYSRKPKQKWLEPQEKSFLSCDKKPGGGMNPALGDSGPFHLLSILSFQLGSLPSRHKFWQLMTTFEKDFPSPSLSWEAFLMWVPTGGLEFPASA